MRQLYRQSLVVPIHRFQWRLSSADVFETVCNLRKFGANNADRNERPQLININEAYLNAAQTKNYNSVPLSANVALSGGLPANPSAGATAINMLRNHNRALKAEDDMLATFAR